MSNPVRSPQSGSSATVLVTGASGRVGRRVVTRLVAAGLRPRCLLRGPASVARLGPLADGIEPVFGDLDDPSSLAAALVDVGQVFLMSPIHERMQDWQSALIDAIVAAGPVRHVVKLSGSTWTQDPRDPTVSGQAHAAIEQQLAEAGPRAGFASTILRPGVFTEGSLKMACERLAAAASAAPPAPPAPLTLALPIADARVAFVQPDTLATRAADALLGPLPTRDRMIEISFTDAVDGRSIAADATTLLGRPVLYRPVPVEQALAAARQRLSGFELRHVGEMLTGIAAGRAARPAKPPDPTLDGRAWRQCLAELLSVPTEPA